MNTFLLSGKINFISQPSKTKGGMDYIRFGITNKENNYLKNFDFVCWGERVVNIILSISVGTLVEVRGKIDSKKEESNNHISYSFNASEIVAICFDYNSPPSANKGGGMNYSQYQEQKKQTQSTSENFVLPQVNDDDLPF